MDDLDPQHGTISGYKYRGCRCADCATASARYEKRRKWLVHQGLTPTLPALGFRRRVHALMAIGWTQLDIARALGIAPGNLQAKLRLNDTVRRATHVAMCEVYEELCMSPQRGVANFRTARIAAKNGWPPPLAWDDIDDPAEKPRGVRTSEDNDLDPVVVDRILAGDWRLASTPAEKSAVCARWVANDGTLGQLERLTGWNAARYYKKGEAA